MVNFEKPLKCPNCSFEFLGSTCLEDPNAVPDKSNAGLCVNCASILNFIFENGVHSLRYFTEEEMNDLEKNVSQWNKMIFMQKMCRKWHEREPEVLQKIS